MHKTQVAKFAALIACTSLLAGCGLKGDLYLPEDATPAAGNSATPAEADQSATPAATTPEG